MTKIHLFSGLIPSIVIWAGVLAISVSGCAPAASPVVPTQTAVESSSSAVPVVNTAASTAVAPTEALTDTPQAIATSRGPELHATDPATVNLASGGLQLVEFFRFT